MKKTVFASLFVIVLILGCAGSGRHVTWSPSLDKAMSMNRPVIVEFTSPT